MRRIAWEELQAGNFELGLVHHFGDSSSRQYVYTLQISDIVTGLSECFAVLECSYLVLEDGFLLIIQHLPFAVINFRPDNPGGCFYSHLLHFWKRLHGWVVLSHSRTYRNNGISFIEENNFRLVHSYIGYHRLDSISQIQMVNLAYCRLWFYNNFFQPECVWCIRVLKLLNTSRVLMSPPYSFLLSILERCPFLRKQ